MIKFTILSALLFLLTVYTGFSQTTKSGEESIKPLAENPYYWAYRGELVLLLGGTWQDNLFNHFPKAAGDGEVFIDLPSSQENWKVKWAQG